MPDSFRYQYVGDHPVASPEYGWETVLPGDEVTAHEEINHPDFRPLKEGEKARRVKSIRQGDQSSAAAVEAAVQEAQAETPAPEAAEQPTAQA